MNFQLEEAIEILERTPQTLSQLLTGLSSPWISCNEGEDTWNAFDVVGAHQIDRDRRSNGTFSAVRPLQPVESKRRKNDGTVA